MTNQRYTGHLYGHLNGNTQAYGDSGTVTFCSLRGLRRLLNRQPYTVGSYVTIHLDEITESVVRQWVRQDGGYYTGFGACTAGDVRADD